MVQYTGLRPIGQAAPRVCWSFGRAMVLCFDSAPLSEAEIKDRTLKKRASLAAMSARNKKKLMLLGAGLR